MTQKPNPEDLKYVEVSRKDLEEAALIASETVLWLVGVGEADDADFATRSARHDLASVVHLSLDEPSEQPADEPLGPEAQAMKDYYDLLRKRMGLSPPEAFRRAYRHQPNQE